MGFARKTAIAGLAGLLAASSVTAGNKYGKTEVYEAGAITVEPGLDIHREAAHLVDFLGDDGGVASKEEVVEFQQQAAIHDHLWLSVYDFKKWKTPTNIFSSYVPTARVSRLAEEILRRELSESGTTLITFERLNPFVEEERAKSLARMDQEDSVINAGVKLIKVGIGDDIRQPPQVNYISYYNSTNIKEPGFVPGELVKHDIKSETPIEVPVYHVGEGENRKVLLLQDDDRHYALNVSRIHEIKLVGVDDDTGLLYIVETNPVLGRQRKLHTVDPKQLDTVFAFPSERVAPEDKFRSDAVNYLDFTYQNIGVQDMKIAYENRDEKPTVTITESNGDKTNLRPLYLRPFSMSAWN